MTSIKQTSFPFNADGNYPFYKVDFDYNFSKVRKVINLETYLFLAVDQQFNLHFIQYRDPYPHEKSIVPPSFALKGTEPIKFSLEYHTLKAFLKNTTIENVNFEPYFFDRRFVEEVYGFNWPDIFYMGEDRLLIKLSSSAAAIIMYYDHRLESEGRICINWQTCSNITPVDSHRVILYEKEDTEAVLTCTLTHKVKTLNFGRRNDIKVLAKHGIALATNIWLKSIEILDIVKNKVIDKVILFNSRYVRIIVDEVDHSGRFLIFYLSKSTQGREKFVLTLWRTLADRTVRSSDEISFPGYPDVIAFLNKDHIIALNGDNQFSIYRLDENGIVKIYNSAVNLDPGYLPKVKHKKKETICSYSSLKVLDENTFVAVRGRNDDVSTGTQHVILFNYAFEPSLEESPRRIEKVTSKVLINHIPDKVLGITHFEDEFVVFLTRSLRLFHYDLQTGILRIIVTLKGINLNDSRFLNIEALSDEYVTIVFHEGECDRVFVISIEERESHLDSGHWFSSQKILNCAVSSGRLFIVYAESKEGVRSLYFGEIDYEAKKIKMISNSPWRSSFTTMIVTQTLLAIATIPFTTVANNGSQKIIFYSLNDKKTLYQVNLDNLSPDEKRGNMMKKIISINDNFVAFFFHNPDVKEYNHYILLWDIDKQCAVAEYSNLPLKRMLGVTKDHLLHTYIVDGNQTGLLDISPYLGKNIKKEEEPDMMYLLDEVWNSFHPDIRCMDLLLPWLPVFAAYDKRIYPNSLLICRIITLKTECLSIIDREIGKMYNPYVTRQVMDMIFGSDATNSSSGEESTLSKVREA